MAIVQRNDPVRLFFRRIGMLALVTFSIFLAVKVWEIHGKERESRMLRNESDVHLNDLSIQESHLRLAIAELKTDRGKEAALREQYEMGKAGERLIIIVDPPTSLPIQASSTLMRWVHTFLPFW
ncbi:hypothetical protein HY970_03270 [Candidatus Kaiserbacteria bacterium]|nr:hypothetical protein [Candidatus Kaiserbacteria bacterium]